MNSFVPRFLFGILTLNLLPLTSSAENVDPYQLIRRVHLRLLDRIPTMEEINRFVLESDVEAMSERVLQSPEFTNRLERFWQSYLGITAPADKEWLAMQIKKDTPIDQRIRDYFSEQKAIKESPDLAFDYVENVGPKLLGESFTCNRCHDHPYEDTRQSDFLGLAAFFLPKGTVQIEEKLRIQIDREQIHTVLPFARSAGERNLKHPGARLGSWLTDYRNNPHPMLVLAGHYGNLLEGREDLSNILVTESSQLRQDRISSYPFFVALRKHKFKEKAFIRSWLDTTHFVAKSSTLENEDVQLKSMMDRDQWLRSIESILRQTLPDRALAPSPESPYSKKISFLESLPIPEFSSLNHLWLTTLGRPIRPSEEKWAESLFQSPDEKRELFFGLLLSHEFLSYP